MWVKTWSHQQAQEIALALDNLPDGAHQDSSGRDLAGHLIKERYPRLVSDLGSMRLGLNLSSWRKSCPALGGQELPAVKMWIRGSKGLSCEQWVYHQDHLDAIAAALSGETPKAMLPAMAKAAVAVEAAGEEKKSGGNGYPSVETPPPVQAQRPRPVRTENPRPPRSTPTPCPRLREASHGETGCRSGGMETGETRLF